MQTNPTSGTRLDEVGEGVYRISTPLPDPSFPFTFNQYLVLDDEPLLFHTGPRGMFPVTQEAIAAVLPVSKLRWIAFSHYENDECGALNLLLQQAPQAQPVCGRVQGLINADAFDRAPRVLADDEPLRTGERSFRWLDMPHLPHGWDAGYLFEEQSRTLLCGDLFTQSGGHTVPLAEAGDLVERSERLRGQLDYYSHSPMTPGQLERLAALGPRLLTCMHGSAFQGDGGTLLRSLARTLQAPP